MNRDMLKLRKDPNIPPSAATVTTSNTNAFSVSPRLGSNTGSSGAHSNGGNNGPGNNDGGREGQGSAGAREGGGGSGGGGGGGGGRRNRNSPKPGSGSTSGSGSGSGLGMIAPGMGIGLTGLGGNNSSSGSKGNNNNYPSNNNSNNNALHTGSRAGGLASASAGGAGVATTLFSSEGSSKPPNTYKFDTNGTLWALSASPDFSMVAVVGRDVLKILSVSDTSAEEIVNLKTVGIRNNFAGSMDVKWGPTTGRDAKIATLGTNGPIVIWDVGTQNKIDRHIKEHTRAVNRICFSPQEPNLLLSASQDGTVRLWDLRVRDRPGIVMEAKADNVREVQFNPMSMTDIVAGYESGNLQRWDLRNASTSEKKFMAHMGFVTSLDFHPSGRFLASGGRDKTIKVWDMEDEKRREIHTIPTIQYTTKVQWRPNKTYHIAACFKDESTVQVFDVRRPYVPLNVLSQHDKDATAILWKDTDVLWTVSKDKTFTSTHVNGLVSAADMLPSGNAAMNCFGQLAFTVGTKGNLDTFEKDLVVKPSRPNARPVALDGSSEPTIYRTRQSAGVFDCELFNFEAFIFCAQNYSTEAGNVREVCEHNSNIAWQASRYRDSQTWTALKLFYSDMTESSVVVAQPDTTPVVGSESVPTSNKTTIDHDDDSDSSDTVTHHSHMQQSRPAIPSLFAIKVSDAPIKRDWSHQDTIQKMLEFYSEHGEVQMCVTILLVLADEKNLPEFPRSQQWFGSYIDLLSRFKLWSIATAVSQACKDPSIHSMNQDSTTIHTSCSHCMKPILTRAPTSSGFWACDRCHNVLSSCSICHKTVRGIFTWCAQCSHGFHLQHAQEWFSQSAECPTGCGHQCFPEMLKIQQEHELLLQQQQEKATDDSIGDP
ncbi:WD repeat-containing protein 24, partial [Podila horticola]